jgi:predicted RNA-binding protein YlqC (UPF0109 family)
MKKNKRIYKRRRRKKDAGQLLGGSGRVARAHLAGPPCDGVVFPSTSPFYYFYFLIHFLCCSLSDDDDVDIKEEEEKRSKKKNLSKHHKSPAFSAPAHQQII